MLPKSSTYWKSVYSFSVYTSYTSMSSTCHAWSLSYVHRKFSRWGKAFSRFFITFHRLLLLYYSTFPFDTILIFEVKLCSIEGYESLFQQRIIYLWIFSLNGGALEGQVPLLPMPWGACEYARILLFRNIFQATCHCVCVYQWRF